MQNLSKCRKNFQSVRKIYFSLHLEKVFDTWKKFCNLRLEATDFSLINHSQEKNLNNLVATRKHHKNPENVLNDSTLR